MKLLPQKKMLSRPFLGAGFKLLVLKTLKLRDSSILICSDSKSVITALERGPLSQRERLLSKVWGLLTQLLEERGVRRIVFQFVYAHCGVVRNEAADLLVEEALKKYRTVDQRNAAIPLQAVKAMVKWECKNEWKNNRDPSRHRFLVCNNAFTDLKLSGTFPRDQEIAAAQLRTGESMLMGKLRGRLGIGSPLCRWCKKEEETVDHVYTLCRDVGIGTLRSNLEVEDVRVLHSNPKLGLVFCGRAISLLHNII